MSLHSRFEGASTCALNTALHTLPCPLRPWHIHLEVPVSPGHWFRRKRGTKEALVDFARGKVMGMVERARRSRGEGKGGAKRDAMIASRRSVGVSSVLRLSKKA